jgi:micrococcal nuclease
MRMTTRAVRVFCLATCLAGCGQQSSADQAKARVDAAVEQTGATVTCVVAKLADGDSFTCADGRKVRLLLMDAPELHQTPWGLMAKRQLEKVASPGTTLRLELDRNPTDRYGRTLAYAWVDSVMVNEWVVANGWAVVLAYENVRYLDRLQRAEQAAQGAKRGFWQAWAFRCRPVGYRAHRCGDAPGPTKRKARRARGATGTS